ncbi:hypothetical protein H8356DRAFT_1752211 [Neocallimastix lanati (nom. inval.)]|nr:hypothetical protein H8356DRAFT_1752211 [Neocallimastix sp. JGI-2020a]
MFSFNKLIFYFFFFFFFLNFIIFVLIFFIFYQTLWKDNSILLFLLKILYKSQIDLIVLSYVRIDNIVLNHVL